jgi:putative tricarboxylic transport membrane protein
MGERYIQVIVSLGLIVLAVLLYRSTAPSVDAATFTTDVYVRFLAIALGASAAFEIIKNFIITGNEPVEITKHPKAFMLLIALLIVYVWSMDYLGFNVSTMLFLVATMYFMGYRSWWKNLLIAAGVTLFVYVLFVKVFVILLPEASLFG